MKNLFTIFLKFGVIMVITQYVLFAFALWNMNPIKWCAESRMVFSILLGIALAFILIVCIALKCSPNDDDD